jgi:hypothetical protein
MTCEFGLLDLLDELVVVAVSASDSCGEMKRAVGRGPVEDGPLVFLRIGCGIEAGGLDAVDEGVVLGLLWLGRRIVMALAAPGP